MAWGRHSITVMLLIAGNVKGITMTVYLRSARSFRNTPVLIHTEQIGRTLFGPSEGGKPGKTNVACLQEGSASDHSSKSPLFDKFQL